MVNLHFLLLIMKNKILNDKIGILYPDNTRKYYDNDYKIFKNCEYFNKDQIKNFMVDVDEKSFELLLNIERDIIDLNPKDLVYICKAVKILKTNNITYMCMLFNNLVRQILCSKIFFNNTDIEVDEDMHYFLLRLANKLAYLCGKQIYYECPQIEGNVRDLTRESGIPKSLTCFFKNIDENKTEIDTLCLPDFLLDESFDVKRYTDTDFTTLVNFYSINSDLNKEYKFYGFIMKLCKIPHIFLEKEGNLDILSFETCNEVLKKPFMGKIKKFIEEKNARVCTFDQDIKRVFVIKEYLN